MHNFAQGDFAIAWRVIGSGLVELNDVAEGDYNQTLSQQNQSRVSEVDLSRPPSTGTAHDV